MKIIDSLVSIFDKFGFACNCCNCNWIVNEVTPGVSFNKLTFHKDGVIFGNIDNQFYKGLAKVTSDRSNYLSDKDCDGVSIVEDVGNNRLLLVDLKSSFRENKFDDAFCQDFFTFLKLHMMLSLCEGYDLKSFQIDCYVACPPCKSEDEADNIKDNILMAEELGNMRFIDKCMKEYFFGDNNYRCKITDTPYVKDRKLHEDILSTLISFHIFTPVNFTDTEGILEL